MTTSCRSPFVVSLSFAVNAGALTSTLNWPLPACPSRVPPTLRLASGQDPDRDSAVGDHIAFEFELVAVAGAQQALIEALSRRRSPRRWLGIGFFRSSHPRARWCRVRTRRRTCLRTDQLPQLADTDSIIAAPTAHAADNPRDIVAPNPIAIIPFY